MSTLIGSLQAGSNNESDFRKMVEYAIKAPSGHNSQPWIFEILNDRIEIHPDFSRTLPVVDPINRELYISLGCAAQNLCIAANQLGYEYQLSVKKSQNAITYISIELHKGTPEKNYLFDFIEKRQTNRSVYNGRTISLDTLDVLNILVQDPKVKIRFFDKKDPEFLTLKEFVSMGNTIQMMDDEFKTELLDWIRFNGRQVRTNSDGLTYSVMKMPALPAFLGTALVGSFLKPSAQNKTDMEKIDSSSHLVLFTIPVDEPESWVYLGLALQRFLLETTRLGIANAYLNQPCEVKKLAIQMTDSLGLEGETPALMLRIGYAKALPYSPRRSSTDVIRNVQVVN